MNEFFAFHSRVTYGGKVINKCEKSRQHLSPCMEPETTTGLLGVKVLYVGLYVQYIT